MGIKQLYNDNLRKLPNEYGDVSVNLKIKSHFTKYSSLISSLSIILTEICIFSKIFKRIQVLQKKQTKFAYFQHAFYILLNVDAYFIVILNCF